VSAGDVVILGGTYAEAGDWRFWLDLAGYADAPGAVLLSAGMLGLTLDRRISRAYITPTVRDDGLHSGALRIVREALLATPGADPTVVFLPENGEGIRWHYGPDPAFGFMTRHVGPRARCTGPDCGEDD
jgi:hypothetical protein